MQRAWKNQISIHALAKRATRPRKSVKHHHAISIHALAKRATACFIFVDYMLLIFQSTPSQRGRPMANKTGVYPVYISIHALAKRATLNVYIIVDQSRFQSTPSQRGRLAHVSSFCLSCLFQSTPSQRGRPGLLPLRR